MRIVLGVIAGAVAAFLCVGAIELIGHSIYPPPSGVDSSDREAVARAMAAVPAAALAFVVAAWFAGALAGAWVGAAVGRRALAGWIVAGLVLVGCIAILLMIPGHPVWMWAAGIVLPLLGGWLGVRFAGVPA